MSGVATRFLRYASPLAGLNPVDALAGASIRSACRSPGCSRRRARLDELHEDLETGAASEASAAATLFLAGIRRAQRPGSGFVRRRELFAPALAAVGLHPDRVTLCRDTSRGGGPGRRRGGASAQRTRGRRRRGRAARADRLAPPSACGRGVGRAGTHPAAMAE